MSHSGKLLGALGEQLAAEFLLLKGFIILSRNVTVKLGEIDILAQDGNIIVLVEVKTQMSASLLDPIYKITPAKQRKLHLLAQVIVARYPNQNIRIDAVTLYWKLGSEHPTITHYENII